MKSIAFTTFLPSWLSTPPSRHWFKPGPGAARPRFECNAGSVRIDWIVNGGYEGTIITDQFPTSKVCSRDKFICVVADFKSTFGYPRLTLNYRSKTYVYPEIHVWNSNEYMNHEIEYWDCI
ncbi:hypothetical protein CPC16_000742 [Podila verticillata]|nr:hypothetical protein CPC16_000742 [Podila verticillata]